VGVGRFGLTLFLRDNGDSKSVPPYFYNYLSPPDIQVGFVVAVGQKDCPQCPGQKASTQCPPNNNRFHTYTRQLHFQGSLIVSMLQNAGIHRLQNQYIFEVLQMCLQSNLALLYLLRIP